MPLANLLAPELLRKAQEIEAAIGPPVPLSAGYLQAGYEKTPYDPKGLVDKHSGPSFDGDRSPGMRGLGMLQRSGDPGLQAFGRGVIEGGAPPPGKQSKPIENASERPMKLVKKGEKSGTKGRVLKLPAGEAGMNEQGQSVTAAGKKLGYLGSPQLVTPYNETPMRNADRRAADVSVARHERGNKFSGDTLMKNYGEHLKEFEANRGEFPKGYFDGMSKTKKANIIDAVNELRAREKIATEGTST